MKEKKKRRLFIKNKILACALSAGLLFAGCGKTGFSVGYEHQGILPGNTLCAMRSDKTDFDIDEVTIEVSFSLERQQRSYYENSELSYYEYACNEKPCVLHVEDCLQTRTILHIIRRKNHYQGVKFLL